MNPYEFENLEVRFDGTQEQADALKERAEALGYQAEDCFKEKDKCVLFYNNGKFGFYYEQNYYDDGEIEETFSEFMTRTAQYLQPKTSPCQAHSNQTHIVDIDGEKWRVELVEKVNEPLTATEWMISGGTTQPTHHAMEAYAAYRLEHFKTYGV